MSDAPPNSGSGTDPLKWPTIFKEWLAPIGTVATAITTLLVVALGVDDKRAQIIGVSVAVILLGVSFFIIKKIRDRRHARALRREQLEDWSKSKRRTAFRGLYPYGESDELPGLQRQREARRLVVQVTDAEYSFGIICGDSGCGKTSLLRSEVQGGLKAEGQKSDPEFSVLYISNPRELSARATNATIQTDLPSRLEQELGALRQSIVAASAGLPLVLILDQFEEFFIEYAEKAQRAELGKFLNSCIHSEPAVRILCAIRRDYLVDMQDLTPELPEPISVKTLFPLKNFTVDEAADIINQCAEFDGIKPDGEFAATLAADLAEGNFVRPPELQIVCTALAGNLTMAEYRLSGGAKGILSHYIGNAIQLCPDANLGRQVLRALCDFPARAKKNPQTVGMIRESVGSSAGSTNAEPQAAPHKPVRANSSASDSLRNILEQFEAARLVVSEERRGEETKYALVHDYLVDAVAMATRDVSTRNEEANQLLEFYRSEYIKDRTVRIPFNRRRFIKKYADRKMLVETRSRQVLRASTIRDSLMVAGLSLIVLIATTALFTIATTRRLWKQTPVPVSNHWQGDDTGPVQPIHMGSSRLLVTYGLSSEQQYARFWDVKTLDLVRTENAASLGWVAGSSESVYFKDQNQWYLVDLRTNNKSSLPFPTPQNLSSVYVNSSDKFFLLIYSLDHRLDDAGGANTAVKIWSIAENKVIGEVALRREDLYYGPLPFFLTDDGEQLFVNGKAAGVWDVRSGRLLLSLLKDPQNSVMSLAVDEKNSLIVTYELPNPTLPGTFYLWKIGVKEPLYQANHPRDIPLISLRFVSGGSLIYAEPAGAAPVFFNVQGLAQVQPCPTENIFYIYSDAAQSERMNTLPTRRGKALYFVCQENETDASIWAPVENKRFSLKNFNLSSVIKSEAKGKGILVTKDGSHAFVIRQGGKADLWDLTKGEKVKDLEVKGKLVFAQFTLDGRALLAFYEDGTFSLYSADSGHHLTEIRDAGGSGFDALYDPDCQRLNIWTNTGRVLRYTDVREILGRDWPVARCSDK